MLLTAAASDAAGQAGGRPSAIELRSGDRIVFLGDSFFEREYPLGLIETALTAVHPEKDLTFRNLGWSGDSVRGEARAYFGKPLDGYSELLKAVDLVTPSVLFVSYGANESFDSAGLEAFQSDYRKLLDDLSSRTQRIVLLTPLPADRGSSPLPQAALDERNRVLSRYSEAIRALAASRGLPSIDLFSAMLAVMSRSHPQPLFERGMHLTAAGYALAAAQIAGRTSPSAPLPDAFDTELAALRTVIVRKNDLFFHRWRPANVTYLYLFRQREQGKNAVEIPRFDPLIAEKELEIAEIRRAAGAAGTGVRAVSQ
jgi:lysophospholipase L1-like esterase